MKKLLLGTFTLILTVAACSNEPVTLDCSNEYICETSMDILTAEMIPEEKQKLMRKFASYSFVRLGKIMKIDDIQYGDFEQLQKAGDIHRTELNGLSLTDLQELVR